MEKCPNELVLIRHGENEFDNSKLNCNLCLSEKGFIQAKWVAMTIAHNIGQIDGVFTSTSKRTIETAQIISPSNSHTLDDRLLEYGWGCGRIDGDETSEEAQLRLNSFFNEIFEKYNKKNILIITHGNLIKTAEDILENGINNGSRRQNIDNCSITRYSRIDSKTGNNANYLRWKSIIQPFETHETQKIIPSNVSIIFVRHGESESNRDGILAGGMNFPLTATGINQAHMISEELSNQKIDFDKIFTSPLSRAIDTARIIAKQCGVSENNIIVQKNLTGCGGGDLEGKSYSEWYATPTEELVSKHGAESYQDQRKRIGKVILDIIKNTNCKKKSIIVSHSSVFQVIQALNKNIKDEIETFKQNKLKSGEYKDIVL